MCIRDSKPRTRVRNLPWKVPVKMVILLATVVLLVTVKGRISE